MVRNHNQMIQQQMNFEQQISEISRRCHILQDWMMSPFRLVPLQVLQDNTMNIDQLHNIISEHPSDNDPWSAQLLELIDHSIAAHFPHFDFPHWDLLHPEIPASSQDVPSEFEGQDTWFPTPHYSQLSPKEPPGEEQISAPPYVPDEEISSPSAPAPNTQEDQQDRDDVIPSPQLNPTMSVFDDVYLFHEETINMCWKLLIVLQSLKLLRASEKRHHGKPFLPLR